MKNKRVLLFLSQGFEEYEAAVLSLMKAKK
jgi:hypothetical protein